MKQKRLLLIASYNRSILLFRKDLLLEFRKEGYEVLAIAHNDSPEVGPSLEAMSIQYTSVPLSRTGFNPFRDFVFLIRLIRIIRDYKPSHILAYTIKPVIYGGIASQFFQGKMFALITGLGYLETETGGTFKKVIRFVILNLYKVSLRKADGVIFQNEDDRVYFHEKKLIDSSIPVKIVNGSGVNLSQFDLAPPVKSPVRFILISRLIRAKGVELYLQAARQIKATSPETEFHLIGQLDEQNPDSISQAELNLAVEAETIIFHGFQNDVRPFLRMSSVFVLPSWYREGVPRTILEALAMGKPVITTDNTGCRETVEPDINGFLVPKKELTPLVNAMKQFIDQPELIETMGRASVEMAHAKFDVTGVNHAMLQFMKVR